MYLRLSLTDRCNLRCTYCLPDQARFAPSRATRDELHEIVRHIHHVRPLRKIRLTGGEPTLVEDLAEHVRFARSLVSDVGMTTNGVLLEPLLPGLRAAGLQKLNVSLDATSEAGFRAFARREGFAQVLASIRAALELGFQPLKVNAVAMQATDYAGLVRWAAYEGVHLRFIELMAIGEARAFHEREVVLAEEMRARIAAAGIKLQECTERDEPTSRVWTINGTDPFHATVGFITTVSQPFCATCDRLRLSSQGRFFTCLMDNSGVDLLAPLRAGDVADLCQRIASAIAAKRPPTVMVREQTMAAIGG